MTRTGMKLGWILPMIVFVVLLVALYSIKARTLAARTQVSALERELVQEKQMIQMLSAEIAHLESPARLSELSRQYLDLSPTHAVQTMSLGEAVDLVGRKTASKEALGAGGANE